MGMNVGTAKGRIAPQMNVTPLVDVVLVLLIIFMVVTPLLTKKFWLHVPKKEEAAEPTPAPNEQKPVVLTYRKDGVIKVNSDRVGIGDLGARLRTILSSRGDGVIFFDAESDADYGEAVRVMDVARGAGATNIAVVTETLLP